MSIINTFSHETVAFINNNKLLCGLTLGLAIVGYCLGNLAGPTVAWLRTCCGCAKRTDHIGRQLITPTQPSQQPQDLANKIVSVSPVPPKSNTITPVNITVATIHPEPPKVNQIYPVVNPAPPAVNPATPVNPITPIVNPTPVIPSSPGVPAASLAPKTKLTTKELWDQLTTLTAKHKEVNLKSSQVHHRFVDIQCPKDSAVKINGKYLHANHVRCSLSPTYFIASQAPMKQEENLFWKAVFDEKYFIFDLTTLEDLEKGVTKYYPETMDQDTDYGETIVKLTKIDGCRRHYKVTEKMSGKSKEIMRYHFNNWKDFGAVSIGLLDELVTVIEEQEKTQNRFWIHCRAGVGRTGTLITAFYLKKYTSTYVQHWKTAGKEIPLDPFLIDLISTLRRFRGPNFVQQPVQLDLLRKYGEFLLSK